ncbi:MAG: STAS domain-containing protein [Bacteroidales bacterium]|jgi:anti-anti-sigma factor|nr:STAS domain-containing protein [Bacteroidales bacterium]
MVSINQIGEEYHVSFNNIPKISIINSKEIESQLIDLAQKEGVGLILNLSEVKFIDSAGFESLLNIYRSAKMNNNSFRLMNVSDEAFELLKLVELDKVFELV